MPDHIVLPVPSLLIHFIDFALNVLLCLLNDGQICVWVVSQLSIAPGQEILTQTFRPNVRF